MNEQDFLTLWKPTKPFATNNIKTGMHRMTKEKAQSHKWIETAPKTMKNLMVLDVDEENSVSVVNDLIWTDGILPEYNFITTNPISGHSQVGFFIDGFVSSWKSQNFFDDIHLGLKHVSGSDLGYGGRTMRNPLVESQITVSGTDALYSLKDLHAFCPDVKPSKSNLQALEGVFGRNDATFAALSKYAYSTYIKLQFKDKEFFEIAVFEKALELNLSWDKPLPVGEVNQIAKSVTKWVVRNFNAETFSKIQSARVKKRWGNQGDVKAAEIMEMKNAGMTVKEIGEALGISFEAAKSAYRRAKNKAI